MGAKKAAARTQQSGKSHGFVIYADIEGYSNRTKNSDIKTLTSALCSAAEAAARKVGWKRRILQGTGDGFICAPNEESDDGKEILEFLDLFQQGFKPKSEKGENLLADIRVRFGVDYGPYFLINPFGTPNVVGTAAINAARVGSLGNGAHVLLTKEASTSMQDALLAHQANDLGQVNIKHGFRLHVIQYLSSANTSTPSKIARQGEILAQVPPTLRRLGLYAAESLLLGTHIVGLGDASRAAAAIALRASLLMPDQGRLGVLGDGAPAERRSSYRYSFEDPLPELEPGRTRFSLNPPEGVPGFAFKHGKIQVMLNLPSDAAKYVEEIVSGRYRGFCLSPEHVNGWSRKARNFISIPIKVAASPHAVAVVSFDFDGDTLAPADETDEKVQLTLSERFMPAAQTDLALMAILVAQVLGG